MTSLASLRRRVDRLQRSRAQMRWCWPILVEVCQDDLPEVQDAAIAAAVEASGCEGNPLVVVVELPREMIDDGNGCESARAG